MVHGYITASKCERGDVVLDDENMQMRANGFTSIIMAAQHVRRNARACVPGAKREER